MLKILIIMTAVSMTACRNNAEISTKNIQSSVITQTANIDTMKAQPFGTDYIMGKFDPTRHNDFVVIPEKFADRPGMYIRKDVLEAYIPMYEAAKPEGINLVIRSATRNFDYQRGIWERKWTGQTTLSDGTNLAKTALSEKEKALRILEYSSMPGTSRHHWGTDIDLNEFTNEWFSKGKGKKVYDWLTANAPKYGFAQVYTPKGDQRPHGYNEEKWHWSYTPISSKLLQEAKSSLTNDMISGFKGSSAAAEIDVVSKYVLGVSSEVQ